MDIVLGISVMVLPLLAAVGLIMAVVSGFKLGGIVRYLTVIAFWSALAIAAYLSSNVYKALICIPVIWFYYSMLPLFLDLVIIASIISIAMALKSSVADSTTHISAILVVSIIGFFGVSMAHALSHRSVGCL